MSACEICTHPGASLFVLVEQFEYRPKRSKAYKSHICGKCFYALKEQEVRFHGLKVLEISQQDYNAHVDPPLAQSFNGDDV